MRTPLLRIPGQQQRWQIVGGALLRFITLWLICSAVHSRAASLPPNATIDYSYSGRSWNFPVPVTRTGSFQAMQPNADADLELPGFDGDPLFAVHFGLQSFTISARNGFIDELFVDFIWSFTLPAGSGASFGSATLVSSNLFLIPPFTFPVVPTVTFDPVTATITVRQFIAAGAGLAMVNADGAATIAFTVVPEPPVSALVVLAASLFASRLITRSRRAARHESATAHSHPGAAGRLSRAAAALSNTRVRCVFARESLSPRVSLRRRIPRPSAAR